MHQRVKLGRRDMALDHRYSQTECYIIISARLDSG